MESAFCREEIQHPVVGVMEGGKGPIEDTPVLTEYFHQFTAVNGSKGGDEHATALGLCAPL